MIKKKERDGKVYIYVRDEDTGIEWTEVVDKAEFEWCVAQKKELEVEDPERSAMLDFGIFGHCSIPKVTLNDVLKFISELQKGEE
ncbi:hypothetical protein WIW89_00160 [Stygiolobus sp. CP850M]|uniref:hypothetical protein n=1 Tax=Stygiolobus sp. CP850M TaxID=3133134 RepID=UPI00307F0B91